MSWWLYVITKQGDPDQLRMARTHPRANTVKPNKTRHQVLAHLLDNLMSSCWWVLYSSARPVYEQPPQGLTYPTVEGGAAPEVSSISCGSFL